MPTIQKLEFLILFRQTILFFKLVIKSNPAGIKALPASYELFKKGIFKNESLRIATLSLCDTRWPLVHAQASIKIFAFLFCYAISGIQYMLFLDLEKEQVREYDKPH